MRLYELCVQVMDNCTDHLLTDSDQERALFAYYLRPSG